jgi:competence protein ComEA
MTSRAVSAALARRRLEALESTFSDGRPPSREDFGDVGDDGVDAADERDLDRVRARVSSAASRGRHAAETGRPARSLALTAQQVTLVALVVAAVVAAAAWWVLKAAPHAEPVQLAEQRVLPSSTPAGDPTPMPTAVVPSSATAASWVVVDVAGKVRHPGIVELRAGSRVVDALHAAGGARRGVDISTLNLARLLVDGEQIVVGLDVPAMPSPISASVGSTGTAIAPVNLNTATLEQLDTLPGIGPVTAQAILDWRTDNGTFTSVDELLEVSGIGDATLADIEAYVYV